MACAATQSMEDDVEPVPQFVLVVNACFHTGGYEAPDEIFSVGDAGACRADHVAWFEGAFPRNTGSEAQERINSSQTHFDCV